MNDAACSRRTFLSTSAAAGLSVGLSQVALAADEPTSRPAEKIRWGIIGTGKRAANAHIPALKTFADFEIIAACDVMEAHLKRSLGAIGGRAQGYADYQKLLANPDVDAVLIATPNLFHHEMVLAALQAGKHVVCEKPMALNYEQCKAMRAAADARPKQVVLYGMQMRYAARYRELSRLVVAGKIGRPKQFVFVENRGDWAAGDIWHFPDPKTGKPVNWRYRYAATGGTLSEKVCHYFDVLHWLAGGLPTHVSCTGGISVYRDGRDVWDNAATTITYANDLTAVHTLCMFAPHRLDLQLIGDEGTIHMDDDAVTFAPRGGGGGGGGAEKLTMPEEVGHGKRGKVEGAVVRMYEDFANCIRSGNNPAMTADMAMASCRTAWLAERSSERKAQVGWDEIS